MSYKSCRAGKWISQLLTEWMDNSVIVIMPADIQLLKNKLMKHKNQVWNLRMKDLVVWLK